MNWSILIPIAMLAVVVLALAYGWVMIIDRGGSSSER